MEGKEASQTRRWRSGSRKAEGAKEERESQKGLSATQRWHGVAAERGVDRDGE